MGLAVDRRVGFKSVTLYELKIIDIAEYAQ